MNTELLKIFDVTKTFATPDGPITAVDHLSLNITSGEIVCLLGPNGAGKTTLLDMVLGLTAPTSGIITVGEEAPKHAIRAGKISALLQTGGLIKDMSVRETLNYIAATYQSSHPVTGERIADVVNQTQLAALLGRKIGKLSGGEQQRVKFALALLPDPSLIILDEPTTGMDVTARRAFWQTMHEHARTGRTVIFATHYLEEAENFADRVVLMNRGRIIADGTTQDVRAITGIRHLRARVDRVESYELTEFTTQFGATITDHQLSCATAQSDELARALLNAGAYDLEIISPSLDDAFASLVTADTAVADTAATEPKEA
ncbi:ABC transporter ATP-binding protein [Arcanobacterium phocisimile]|uniref:ABC transporter ATP-binding protein n=1 Tax=Arcanobacterium phocisimile TaxID=1302235 RepID=A0ABX7IJH0_9ACTO|nr:ABC transporter ATP-binding protein [Arcanobacterium phocisimile]QRV01988.1 ABC transporter ATP-binding protein [Arcanobacterium phocisimile]